jgi:hypothetical protein
VSFPCISQKYDSIITLHYFGLLVWRRPLVHRFLVLDISWLPYLRSSLKVWPSGLKRILTGVLEVTWKSAKDACLKRSVVTGQTELRGPDFKQISANNLDFSNQIFVTTYKFRCCFLPLCTKGLLEIEWVSQFKFGKRVLFIWHGPGSKALIVKVSLCPQSSPKGLK